jgi:transcriptional regulator with XRE-family HTH domain
LNHLRSLREAKGLTLEQIASALGTTNQQISLLEHGKRQLTVAWLTRLSAVLDCHPWALVDGSTTSLSASERDLVARVRRLNPSDRDELTSRLAQLEVDSRPPKAKAS